MRLAVLVVAGLACLGAGSLMDHWHHPRLSATELSEPTAPRLPTTSSPTATSLPSDRIGQPGSPALVAAPVAFSLPGYRVQAPVVAIGQLSHTLDLPADPHTVGWWAAGAAPGDGVGSAVLAGHVDSARHGTGVLASLVRVRLGDDVIVTDGAGTAHHFAVTSRHLYDKQELPSWVFDRTGPPRLVVVTCAGDFDLSSHHYADNLVVVAKPRGPG